MNRFRLLFFAAAMLGIAITIWMISDSAAQPPFARSFSSLFQVVGKPIKTIDRTISHLYPVHDMDEKSLGDEIIAKLSRHPIDQEDAATVVYLNALVQSFKSHTKKPFNYTVFLEGYGSPNACALPGGAICITKSLLDLLTSEAELVGILGHEIGHIERGHLFDAMRSELLQRRISRESLAAYIPDVLNIILRQSFSKTEEDEADEYGFRLLLNMGYDPFAMSSAFEKLCRSDKSKTSLIGDFFATHPQPELRMENYRSRAQQWKASHPNEKSYVGTKNLQERIPRVKEEYDDFI